MNRVAAQTARDRKKQYVVELEKKLAQLEDQVLHIVHDNYLHIDVLITLCP